MIPFFTDVFSYQHKFNLEVIQLLRPYPKATLQKSNHWMVHILEAHRIWLERIENQIPEFRDDIPMDDWLELENSNYNRSINIINHKPLDRPIRYENSAGKSFVNTLSDILYHVTNHTTHHRAMIIASLRESGVEPPVTDYIFYKR